MLSSLVVLEQFITEHGELGGLSLIGELVAMRL